MASAFSARCAAHVAWSAALERYHWRGDYKQGLAARSRLSRALASGLNRGHPEDAVDEITRWGRVPVLRGYALQRTLASLPLLDRLSGTSEPVDGGIYAARIATVSKVYAMHDLSVWVIYDSRVAWAIEALRSRLAPDTEPSFGQPLARTAPPFPGAPLVRTERQGQDGFLRASATVRDIARQIREPCPDSAEWTAPHVEMALFTMGALENREDNFMVRTTGKITATASKATPAGATKNALVKVAGSDLVRGTLEDQITLFLEQQFAKVRAMRFARETDSVAAQAQFADGHQRWVIFHREVPIASFPGYEGDLEDGLRFHNLERLQMRDPRDLAKEIEADREKRKRRWKIWARGADDGREQVVEELLQLEAGPPID